MPALPWLGAAANWQAQRALHARSRSSRFRRRRRQTLLASTTAGCSLLLVNSHKTCSSARSRRPPRLGAQHHQRHHETVARVSEALAPILHRSVSACHIHNQMVIHPLP